MICTESTKWKYLREDVSSKSYRPSRNTSLAEYLYSIFPGETFVHDAVLDRSELPEGAALRHFRVDYICRARKLAVEFDGVNHYMDTQVCINDSVKDEWLKSAGYAVVRIPYWIQLSGEVIQDLFNIEVKDPYCELEYSFYDPENQKADLNILPGNMCELGRKRFISEFRKFSPRIRQQIVNDLNKCCEYVHEKYGLEMVENVLPKSILDNLLSNLH